MMRLACLVALAAWVGGCSSDDADDYPVSPGGGGGDGITGGTMGPDARVDAPPDGNLDGGVDGGDAGPNLVMGKVCVVSDLRALTTCDTGDASGLTVTVESATATTTANGMFTIFAPSGSSPIWRVSGTGYVPSVVPLSGTLILPVVKVTRYDDLQVGAGAQIRGPGSGVVIATVKRGTARVPDVGVVATGQVGNTLYDNGAADEFASDATGDAGLAWMSSVPVGTAQTVTVTGQALTNAVTATVRVESQAITFVTIAL